MSNYICTLYAHDASFDLVTNEAKKLFPAAEWEYNRRNEFTDAILIIKGGFLRPKKKVKISYRERDNFSADLVGGTCPVTSNLLGMQKMVENIQTTNKEVQAELLKKIRTINAEFSIIMLENGEKEFKSLVEHLATNLDAFIFAQPRTGLMNSLSQSFLDKDLHLILDVDGNSNIDHLEVSVNPKYTDKEVVVGPEQLSRKERSELFIKELGLKVNPELPTLTTSESVGFRSAKEIAERIASLAVTNLVAFNNISGDQAIQYATKHEIIDFLSPKEIEFLKSPTIEAKNQETWKCEAIWTLFWALSIVSDLESAEKLADLTNIPEELYPVGAKIQPADFIRSHTSIRSSKEILDASDLYYRMNCACVEAQTKGDEISGVHPGVVYERHCALNWLINHKDQDWDNVTAGM